MLYVIVNIHTPKFTLRFAHIEFVPVSIYVSVVCSGCYSEEEPEDIP